jgi:DNA-directed RNA polymerase specialized sigma24 family protein
MQSALAIFHAIEPHAMRIARLCLPRRFQDDDFRQHVRMRCWCAAKRAAKDNRHVESLPLYAKAVGRNAAYEHRRNLLPLGYKYATDLSDVPTIGNILALDVVEAKQDPWCEVDEADALDVIFNRAFLSTDQRAALYGHYWVGHTDESLAEERGLTYSTVRSHRLNGLIKIRFFWPTRR